MTKFLISFLALCCSAIAQQVTAADTTVTVSGTVVIPPCEIYNADTNDNTPISVDFGDVGIGKIDGVSYSKPVPWKISCQGSVDVESTIFYLNLRATATDFDPLAFKTDVDGLGIRLRFGPLVMIPGNGSTDSSPAWVGDHSLPLTVVPVKKAGVELAPGTFTAIASLILTYQ